MITNITIGTDPEMFIIDNNNNSISAEGLLGGTKRKPRKLSNNGHAVQEDNVMVEFNIPPVIDYKSFIREIKFCKTEITKLLPSGMKLIADPSMEFSEKVLKTKQASTFGCSIDFDVWTTNMMTPIKPHPKYRFAGGHIHVGWDTPEMEISEQLVKAMDLFLGVPAVIMDNDDIRKQEYGKAGRFRFTKYGIEYRTISNFWLKNTSLQKWVFNQTLQAITFVNNNNIITNELKSNIINAINNNDKILATNIINKYNISIITNGRVRESNQRSVISKL